MKRILIILNIILVIFLSNSSYAKTSNETLNGQQEEFKVHEFLNSAKKFTGEFFEDIDISNVFEEAIKGKVDNSKLAKGFLRIFGQEVSTNLKSFRKHFSNYNNT